MHVMSVQVTSVFVPVGVCNTPLHKGLHLCYAYGKSVVEAYCLTDNILEENVKGIRPQVTAR